MKYSISDSKRNGLFSARANSVEDAALHTARRLYGRRNCLTVERVTGTGGKSGYFQAYRSLDRGMSSIGNAFHVAETAPLPNGGRRELL